MAWMFLSLQNSRVGNLFPSATVLGGGVFGEVFRLWGLCREEWIHVAIKRLVGVGSPLSCPSEDKFIPFYPSAFCHVRTQQEGPHQTKCWCHDLDIQPLELLENKFLLFCINNLVLHVTAAQNGQRHKGLQIGWEGCGCSYEGKHEGALQWRSNSVSWLWWWLHKATHDKTAHTHTHTYTACTTGAVWRASVAVALRISRLCYCTIVKQDGGCWAMNTQEVPVYFPVLPVDL